MSLDRSLKAGSSLKQHRNVLTRPERIARLMEAGEFSSENGKPLGLRKVVNRKLATGKKVKKEAAEGAEGAAAPAAAAPAAKGAAPGGKAAAGKAPAGKAPAGKAPAGKGEAKKK